MYVHEHDPHYIAVMYLMTIIVTIAVIVAFIGPYDACVHLCSGLPSKSQDDIIRHQLMYDQMVEEARKKGWYISYL